MLNIRSDALGRETQFHVCCDQISRLARNAFETMLTHMALGYTKLPARGGWKGVEEDVIIYRVASLSENQIDKCVAFLLTHTSMTDLYVVMPTGTVWGHGLSTDGGPTVADA